MKYIKTFEGYNKNKGNLLEQQTPFNHLKFNNLTEQDLYDMAKKGLLEDYPFSGCWDNAKDSNDIKGAIEAALEDFKSFLNKPYPVELGNIPENPTIYRLVRLKSPQHLNKDYGVSWFSNPDVPNDNLFFQMLDYLKPFENKDGVMYRLKGETTLDNIDVYKTLWERSTQWGENEIVVKTPNIINIIDIEKCSDIY